MSGSRRDRRRSRCSLAAAVGAIVLVAAAPSAVAVERARVVCWDRHQAVAAEGSYEQRPTVCRLWRRGHGDDPRWAIRVRGLRWKAWGGEVAAATAKAAIVTTAPPVRYAGPIEMKLSGLVTRKPKRVYSKASFLGPDLEFSMWLYRSP